MNVEQEIEKRAKELISEESDIRSFAAPSIGFVKGGLRSE